MNDLVQRLSSTDQPIEASLRPDKTVDALKAAVERGYVHVKFTETRGGTELGFPLDRSRSDVAALERDGGKGTVTLCGDLVLNFEKVRCVAEVDLDTLTGTGRLEVLS
jgi:hypothetical protein